MKSLFLLFALIVLGWTSNSLAQDDWRGTYTYTRGEATYEIEIYGPPGELEGDFKCTSEGGSYKISLNLIEDGDFLKVEAVKIYEGTCPIASKINADKLMLRLTHADGELITEIGSHSLGGFTAGYQDVLFSKTE
ncbi:MAG: hypothetical protein KDC84_04590 [Crocinitomicaceae bacterium]|nr:hypothetical protein [Crocinitomicaceae bacterium]